MADPGPRPVGDWLESDFRRWPVWAGPGWSVGAGDLEGVSGQDESSVQPLPGVERICDAPHDPVTVAVEGETTGGVQLFGWAVVTFLSYLTYEDPKLLRFEAPAFWWNGRLTWHYQWRPAEDWPLGPPPGLPAPPRARSSRCATDRSRPFAAIRSSGRRAGGRTPANSLQAAPDGASRIQQEVRVARDSPLRAEGQ